MSDHRYNPDQKAKLDDMLLGIPGVKASTGFGYPVYKVNGKIFALVGSSGVAVKLPAPRVESLIDKQTKFPFKVADQIIWHEWVSIQHADVEDYEADLELFQEALEYVASK